MTQKKSNESTKSSKKEKLICTAQDLADMYGVSLKQIYNQVGTGIAVKVGSNKFDCVQSVANYINQMREREEMRKQTPEEIRNEVEIVKLQHEKLKSRKTELTVLQMEGKLHYEEDVKSLWNSSVVAAKSRLSGISVKVAPQIRGETSESVIKEHIDREIRDALKELSEYDASKYEKDLSKEEEESDE